MSFSERLKEARLKSGLSQRELSAISGVSQQAISVIENGARSPSEATMTLLAKALGLSVMDLMDQKSPSPMPEDELDRQLLNLIHQLTPEKKKLLIEFLQQK